MTRWKNPAFEGAGQRIVAGGAGNATLVVLRENQDPVRSLDGGKTWSAFTVRGSRPLDVSVSPADGRTWYAVVSEGTTTSSSPQVIYRTRDGGNTWDERTRMSGYGLAAPQMSSDPDVLYMKRSNPPFCGFICTPSDVYVLTSRDGGLTWSESAPTMRVGRLEVSPVDARVAYAGVLEGTYGNVRRTVDGGATWTQVELPPADPTGRFAPYLWNAEIALDRMDAAIAYVRPEQPTSAFAKVVFVTRDGGQTWLRTEAPPGWVLPDPGARGRAYLRAIVYAEFVNGAVRYTYDHRVLESRDAGATWVAVDGGEIPLGQVGPVLPDRIQVVLEGGTRTAVGVLGQGHPGKAARLDLTHGALDLASDLWWNPAAPGTGLTITQHASNQVFMVWYTYDAAGKQLWRVMPGGAWSDRVLTGTLYETDGPPYFQGSFDTSRVKLTSVGVATMDFRDENNATLVHRNGAGAVQSTTPISRMQFGDLTKVQAENFADIWYNAAESGWGMGISQQGDRIFATWYVYDEAGEPMWIIMPDSVVQLEFNGFVARPSARGDIYTTRGTPEGGYTTTKVGTAQLFFRSINNADLNYTAFGKSSTVQVTRIPF